jgi:hypothetical protein
MPWIWFDDRLRRAGEGPKDRLVTIAFAPSLDTLLTKGLGLVALDLSDSISGKYEPCKDEMVES